VSAHHARRRLSAVAAILTLTALLVGCSPTRITAGVPKKAGGGAAPAAADDIFAVAKAGDCLDWPAGQPMQAHVVDCKGDHRFEVAGNINLASEYGPGDEPPSDPDMQMFGQQRCVPVARQYLGPKFDPNSRFSNSVLWAGADVWRQSGDRHVLCGLQLTGSDGGQLTFSGRVADQDQSKVWPTGTCLGINAVTDQPTDLPVDCATAHAIEVTGTVDVGAQFPGAQPSDADQDAFVEGKCSQLTDDYLGPIKLQDNTLSVIYSIVETPSWDAGSRRLACGIGAVDGGHWATLRNGVKGALLINGQPAPH
jgi:hypothetical protein